MIILAGILTALAPTPAGAATININPVKDNMLYPKSPSEGSLSSAVWRTSASHVARRFDERGYDSLHLRP